MPRDKFLLKFNDETPTISSPLTREWCYQNNLYGAKYPEVFGFRIDDQNDSAHLAIVDRAIDYFHRLNDSYDLSKYENDDMWGHRLRDNYFDFEKALLQRDRESVSETLRKVCDTKLVTGFYLSDMLERSGSQEDVLQGVAWHIFDTLVSMASAFGYPIENPEQGNHSLAHIDFEEIFEFVLQHVPALRHPPRAGGGIFGVRTLNGVIAWRDFSAAFNATRVVENLGNLPRKVCEIGGGMGSLAYYLARMGVSSSVFDIPVVSLLQSYFLMTSLGGDQVWIYGEEPNPSAKVRILPWWELVNTNDNDFSLVVNVDSLAEIELGVALNYVDLIHSKGQHLFLSINQESGALNTDRTFQNIVGDLVAIRGGFKRTYRFPYWLRAGYVEELFQIVK
ncbi:MAG: putative sugar O-methyltransferase [Mycobacterium sp.]